MIVQLDVTERQLMSLCDYARLRAAARWAAAYDQEITQQERQEAMGEATQWARLHRDMKCVLGIE